MKLLNYTTAYFAVILLFIISIWAGIFYFAMLDEIYDSIDDGLDNRKGLIIRKATQDSIISLRNEFGEGDYTITPVPAVDAGRQHDAYRDTLMFMENEQEYEPVRILTSVFSHRNNYYKMQVITSMVEEDDLIAELLHALIWLYLGLIATILLLNNFLLRRIWKPFYHLIHQLSQFRLEKPSIQLKESRIEEFTLLNKGVNNMIGENINSYNSQKHFIENAAHELQTPLAIAINKLESLAEKEQLSAEGSATLIAAMENLDRLKRLNKSLLVLSRIENNQYLSKEIILFNALIREILTDFDDQLQYLQIKTTVQEEEELQVEMNKDLAHILVLNLLKNAIIHNHRDGSIQIIIKRDGLTISNTGSAKPLDEGKLFSRFYKEHVSPASSGLGLSIAKAITNLYHFQLKYTFNAMHTIEVNFSSKANT